MNRRARTLIAAVSLAFTALAAQADGDAERGHKLAYTCLGCHGIENYKNAYPKYSVPKLGGQNTAYLVAALGEYKAGDRWHPTMKGLATSLTDQDRADLAAYFSSGRGRRKPEAKRSVRRPRRRKPASPVTERTARARWMNIRTSPASTRTISRRL